MKGNAVTKELLKAEIDKVPEEHLGVLFRIVQALEEPAGARDEDAADWKAWVNAHYGSFADAPLAYPSKPSLP
jgi:hypothetical protein